jgi:hypothetical protein
MFENQRLRRLFAQEFGRMTRKAVTSKRKTGRTAKTAPRPSRPTRPDTIELLIAANARALALPVDPAWQAGIKLNLRSLFAHAVLVDEFSLPDETEPAPVFRA